MSKQLRHLHAVDDDVRALAAERRDTWEDAVAAYLARRRRALEQEYASKASFDRSAIRAQARALPVLGELICGGVLDIPDSPHLIDRHDGEDERDHQIRLGQLLTPPGWEGYVKPRLQERRKQAMSDAFAEKDEETNVALVQEIDKALSFLHRVEQQAFDARVLSGRLAREPKQRHEAAM